MVNKSIHDSCRFHSQIPSELQKITHPRILESILGSYIYLKIDGTVTAYPYIPTKG